MKPFPPYPACRRSRLPKGIPCACLKPFLVPASWLYYLGIKLWTWVMDHRKPAALPGMTVSVGNLTAGGTGKTPAVLLLADWALKAGYKVAVLSRGYGGRYRETVLEVSDGTALKCDAFQAGDEPCMLAAKLPGVPVVLAKKRVQAGQWSRARHQTDFFILDDGFQHRALKRDLDLVLLDAEAPFHNGCLLPRGLLREPVAHLKRAHALIITRADRGHSNPELETFLKTRFPQKPVFRSAHVPEHIVFPERAGRFPPEYLSARPVAAFAGIADPQAFRTTLQQLGAEIRFFKEFPDHHYFSMEEIRDLAEQSRLRGADLLITTEKDWMRIRDLGGTRPELAFLTVRFRIVSDEHLFFDLIKNKAREIIGY